MRKSMHEVTIENLEREGWEFCHTALVNHYVGAGSISGMKSRNGFDYCRVHHGKCVGSHTWQVTSVMRKEATA